MLRIHLPFAIDLPSLDGETSIATNVVHVALS